MKIVILDAYCANPGDLSWEGLEKFGDLTVYDRTPADMIIERARGCEAIFTNKTPLSAETLAALPECRFISVLATGFNIVDTAYCKEHGITVCNVPGYSTDSVVQLTMALLLELCFHVGEHTSDIHAGGWKRSPDFNYTVRPLMELAGKTMGIVGYGTIGRKVARAARAFGMEVVQYSRHPKETDDFVKSISFEELLRVSDVVSLHCPFNGENRNMMNEAAFAMMKPTALLINTARGQIVDEAALRNALDSGVIAGAGVDVLSVEPMAADCPLCGCDKIVMTPHIAWATPEARVRLMDISIANLRAYIEGRPQNVVNA